MHPPLKINFFVQFVHEQGTYFRFHNLARALRAAGEDVTVYGCDNNWRSKARIETRDEVPYVITNSVPGSRFIFPANNPINEIRRGFSHYPACDIAHLFQPFLSGRLAWRRTKARRHFFDWDDLWGGGLFSESARSLRGRHNQWITEGLEHSLPAKADHTTTCSGFLARLAQERGARETTVIPNGYWPALLMDRAEARARLGLRADALYVGFMGRTCNELTWCVEALAKNMEHHSSLRFAVCGAPTDAFAHVPEPIRSRIDHLGQLPSQMIPQFAAALDLGLLPLEKTPFNESRFPVKLAEYLGAGAPVLCSQVGEIALLTQGLQGVISAGSTKKAWLEAFSQTIKVAGDGRLTSPETGAVETIFGWGGIGKRLIDVYRASL
ncbi:MAG: glycosyltransferase [Opitutaceae bacterium]|jgi:glycosyltransferase involved in cell wall biosynthesis